MRSRHVLTVSIPLPSILPPQLVIDILRAYEPALRHNFDIERFLRIPSDPDSIAGDSFFAPWDDTVRTFHVWELTELVPGLKVRAEWPIIIQWSPDGIKWRVMAPIGINVWAHFIVRPRAPTTPSGSTSSSSTNVGDEWELYDEMIIEGNRLMMPFTLPYAHRVHRVICEKLVEEAFQDYIKETLPE